MPARFVRVPGLWPVVLVVAACGAGSGDGPPGEIVNITGDLYGARSGIHNTVFFVTPDGVILSDPLNPDFAQWLKEELAQRFGSTVAYVVYSHHHPDHAAGGTVFADTATFVAHEGVAAARETSLPSNAATLDRNADGRLDRAEATGLAYDRDFDRYDVNGDEVITGAEINAGIPAPDVVYTGRMTLTLGGRAVELFHPGPAHSDDMTVILFPEERAVFGVDFMHVKRFPATLGGYPVASYVDAIARVQALDFDIVIPGHGEVGVKEDLAAFLDFLRALEAGVADAMANGRSLEEMHETLHFPGYEDWLLYEARRVTLITETHELLAASAGG